MKFVVDASVAAKWFNVEQLSEKAVELKDAHVRGVVELAGPTHLVYEVGNSIWKNSQLKDRDAHDAIAALLALALHLLAPSIDRVRRTMEIARQTRRTFYDSSYLQVAEELKAPLLTADKTQLAGAKDIIQAIHLRDAKL